MTKKKPDASNVRQSCSGLRNLGRLAGIPRQSNKGLYEKKAEMLTNMVAETIRAAAILASNDGRASIKREDIAIALRRTIGWDTK